MLAGATLVSMAVTFPIALSSTTPASAGALVVAHERGNVLAALRAPAILLAVGSNDGSGDDARLAVDGREDTAWAGRPGDAPWAWSATFAQPVHLGLLRARFGSSPTSGVPTSFRWEVRPPASDGRCDSGTRDDLWRPLDGARQVFSGNGAGEPLAQPTRRSWFVDAEACGLRLVIDRTNVGPPVVREVQAIESARDVLLDAAASDDGAYPGFRASDAVDGTYEGRWAGAPGRSRWTLRVDLPRPQPINRVRLVLGFDATSVPRPEHGRNYAIAWGPQHYVLEGSEDGKHFFAIAGDPLRPDGSVVPLRRRLVTLSAARKVKSLRLVIAGATGGLGIPGPGAVPVVREIAAYRSDDPRPILASPWLLSVNANPSAESHLSPGGEVTNDAYWAKFLQRGFAKIFPLLRRDDRFDRALGPHGEPLDAPPSQSAGSMLESIEGDDPQLDSQLLAQSSPPPVAVLSGSDDWDYAGQTEADPQHPKRWHWDPLRDARAGGIGQLASAVRQRVAPFLGFCGGAQILGLLEAKRADSPFDDDRRTIDLVLRRTSGRPIRGFAPSVDVERAWPDDRSSRRAKIEYIPSDRLFADLAGPLMRSTTQALPESHSDAIRVDAFLPGGPLQRFELLATSPFCAPDVVAASPRDGIFPNPSGPGWCDTVTQAFRSKDPAWPIIGAQFHAEQRDFTAPGPGDPPESIADPELFMAAAFEQMVDAYVKLAP